ncbi:M15 family metallopeptidase [Tritonibacter mobilis]|uniref:M15 family metallopeptidase n=1 Tax=Tritonibacter mobilis TaxID=379347 RepID=UPI001404228C|nr:M15 family metallopeptidase [Tritonibacter mobilis]NHM20311.1 M15 family metallopeptidase [Tritonibacter mobilis]NHM24475.1 M15 family metallopeptidase [Tritonibacter mobilis]
MSGLLDDVMDWWRNMRHRLEGVPVASERASLSLRAMYPREKMQAPRRQSRYRYVDGPMYYLGQQIVKAMEDAGYPAKILYCYRSPEKQRELYSKGRTSAGPKVTNARPWDSAHQYYEAVDIIHPSLGWNVTEEYWETLAACVRIVSEKFSVGLNHGHRWKFRDSAHIELRDWRSVRERHRRNVLDQGEPRPPNADELWYRFYEVLPDIVKAQYNADQQGRVPKDVVPTHPDLVAWLAKKSSNKSLLRDLLS